MSTAPIIRDVKLNAPPEKVFDAFSAKVDLEAWFAARAEVNAVDGGKWHYTWPPHMAASGTFIKVDWPHELLWTWEESIQDDTLAEQPAEMLTMPVVTLHYRFEAEGDGTVLHIEESGHERPEIREMNEQGIDGMIPTLRAWVENGERVDWSVMEQE